MESVENRYRDYFSFFHITPTNFFRWGESLDLHQYDQEAVISKVRQVCSEPIPFANSALELLTVLATVEHFRKIILNHLDWNRALDIYLPDGAVTERMVEPCFRMCHLLANLASFADSYHVLFSCNTIKKLNITLRQVHSSFGDLESKYKCDLVLNAVRAISNLTLNDSYQDKLGLFDLLLQIVNDTIVAEQLNFETIEKQGKNRLKKEGKAVQIIRYCAKALANLSSQGIYLFN